MNFRTQIPIVKQSEASQVDYASKILLIGSCFSENIGNKFEYYKFQNTVNPFGILFHPQAIELFLTRVVKQNCYSEEELIFHNERYHCFDVHSSLSHSNKEVLLSSLDKILKSTYQQITESTHLIITLGTAWVYEHIGRNQVVANCHKIPQKEFGKRILSVQEIETSLRNMEQLVRSINNKIQFIYTVSPVRHIKDGFIENQQSKSHLVTAIHNILSLPVQYSSITSYFPSYEIMMDELRDYRFYAKDMLHPNQTAIDFIWNQFKTVWVKEKTIKTMKVVATIQNGLAHKPFNASSEQHQLFLKQLEYKKENLLVVFPFMKF